jgi:hypothetical protein
MEDLAHVKTVGFYRIGGRFFSRLPTRHVGRGQAYSPG